MPNTTDFGGFNFPNIAKPDLSYTGASPSYTDVIAQLNKIGDLPSLSSTLLPTMKNLLSPEGQAVSPYAQKIEKNTASNVAQKQTDYMKRGMTGSDIEMQGIQGAQAAGQTAIAELYGQTANQLAQMIYQAATGDINSNKELLLTIAQAMGQELTSQRDLSMFHKALQASVEEANRARSAAKSAAMGGMFGQLGGTMAGAGAGAMIGSMILPGAGTLIGAGVGGMAGGGIGKSTGSALAM